MYTHEAPAALATSPTSALVCLFFFIFRAGLPLTRIMHLVQERQREVSAGLRSTYEKLVKTGMIKETNPDGTPAKVPDMDEVRSPCDINKTVRKG